MNPSIHKAAVRMIARLAELQVQVPPALRPAAPGIDDTPADKWRLRDVVAAIHRLELALDPATAPFDTGAIATGLAARQMRDDHEGELFREAICQIEAEFGHCSGPFQRETRA